MSDEMDEQPQSRVVQMPRRNPALTSPATILIGVVNVAVFVAMVVKSSGGAIWEPSISTLLNWGANFGPMTAGGQPWRLLTSMFLHVGVIHIFANMYALYNVGPATERYFGSARYLLLYFIAGLGGACVSMLWHPDTVSAGASGAIFGILGGMLAFITLLKRLQPNPQLGQIQLSILKMIGLNVFIGLTIPRIDNGAHLGGLFFGGLTGLALAPLQSRTARVSSGVRAMVGVVAVLLLLLGTGFVAMRRINANPQLVAQRNVTTSDEEDTAPPLQPLLEQQSTLIGKLNLLAKHVRAGTSPTGADKQSPGEMEKFAASLVKSADSDLAQLKTLDNAAPDWKQNQELLIERGARISSAAHALEKAINGDDAAMRKLETDLKTLNQTEEP